MTLSDPARVQWQGAVDFVLVALVLYGVLVWARRARALRLALMVVGLHVAAVGAPHLGLAMTSRLLHGASLVALLVFLVLFQPELRHGIVSLERVVSRGRRSSSSSAGVDETISAVAFSLAQQRLGALIVMPQAGPLSEEVTQGGTRLGAEVSAELLEALFLGDSRLHDGAVIVEGDRIARAGVLLPLTPQADVPSHFGSRHRAALGIAACCDAAVIAVSQERGEVHLIHRRRIRRMAGAPALLSALRDLRQGPGARSPRRAEWLARADPVAALAAALLAGLVWLVRLLETAGC